MLTTSGMWTDENRLLQKLHQEAGGAPAPSSEVKHRAQRLSHCNLNCKITNHRHTHLNRIAGNKRPAPGVLPRREDIAVRGMT